MIIPLFPLNAVLFPGGPLPLRIFEPRYLDMVSDCMKSEKGIGVILIEQGQEAGAAAKSHDVGTMSSIAYWHKRKDGMLGVTLKGEQRFKVISSEIKPNQLIIAEIELLDEFKPISLDKHSAALVKLLKQIIALLEPPYTTMEKFYDDIEWVSARLIELLPLEFKDKQKMLLMGNVEERIEYLYPLLVSMKML